MPQEGIWGWDADNSRWVKILVDSTGRLIIDPSAILENPPTEDESAKAPTSEWAFDHKADASAHHERYNDLEAVSAMGAKADNNPLNHDRYTDALAVIAAKTVKLDDFTAPDNNTDLDATAAAHGLLPKLSDVATEYLGGTGAFSVPAGGAGVKVKAETRGMTTASGDVSYTGYGFTPTGLIVVGFESTGIRGSVGGSDPAVLEACMASTGAAILAASARIVLLGGTTTGQGATVLSYDPDGFTLTWTKYGLPTGTANLTVFAFK